MPKLVGLAEVYSGYMQVGGNSVRTTVKNEIKVKIVKP
jgi:hypothetical protein